MFISAIFIFLVSSAENDLAIFNQWLYHNPPVLFNWSKGNEVSEIVQNFENPGYYQMKWTCAAQIDDKMFVFGGETLSGAEITTVQQIIDCQVTDTEIPLPFAMSGHSCTSDNTFIYICSSIFAGQEKACTKFDGAVFSSFPSTRTEHALGAMAMYLGNPVILGGIIYQGADTNTVEKIVSTQTKKDSWRPAPSMITGRRIFTAVSVGTDLYAFGGYFGSVSLSSDAVEYFNGNQWQVFPLKLMVPRHGHSSISYLTNPATVLHVGGGSAIKNHTNYKMQIEKWEFTTSNEVNITQSDLVLDTYTDFPAIFNVDSVFCKKFKIK